MNELTVFNNEDFGEIRTMTIEGEPWFVAADVCRALDLSNPTIATSRLDEDERAKFNLGRQGDGTIINESGLYSLVLGSRKPEAKAFKRWITHDIIPTIRKTGGYVNDTAQFIDSYFGQLDPSQKHALTMMFDESKRMSAQLKEQAPKVLFANAVETAHNSILIGDLAKIIRQNGVDIGQKRLFDWMRQNGYLIKGGQSKNMPTQKAMDMNLFEVKESTVNNPDGSVRITRTTKVTGKGQTYFVKKFLA
jgi:anti-repressor protein